MVRSVFARKCFVSIEQEEQWSAEHVNVLCRLKNHHASLLKIINKTDSLIEKSSLNLPCQRLSFLVDEQSPAARIVCRVSLQTLAWI